MTEEQLDLWCKEIDEEEKQKELEIVQHNKWLRERELKKQEIERAWRPVIKTVSTTIGQKRKASDSLDSISNMEEEAQSTMQEPQKPPVSPLLTSLLKSPSHAQNIATSSILHTAITSQKTVNVTSTIASLLNTNTNVSVSPGLQQLVSTAIGQEPVNMSAADLDASSADILDGHDPLPNLKVEDIESTILSSDDPLPEIKNEEVEVIISDLIENPEQHLALDDNDDIISNLENELDELVNKENAAKEEEERVAREQAEQKKLENFKFEETEQMKEFTEQIDLQVPQNVGECVVPKIDPFEFQEEPEMFQPSKQTPLVEKAQMLTETYEEVLNPELDEHKKDKDMLCLFDETTIKKEIEEPKKENQPGSVEIVEVVVMDDEEMSKELNKSEIEDIVHSNKADKENLTLQETDSKSKQVEEVSKLEKVVDEQTDSLDLEIKTEVEDINENEESNSLRRPTFTPEYAEDIFDDMNVEVTKLDKTGKAKRDYSRTKKKEEKENFDILLAVEKVVSVKHLEDELNEVLSEKDEVDEKKLEIKHKIKLECDRSNSPWTEEEETNLRSRRRYSTPATPVDSVPNSPASSINYDDDRDYRNWKKSVLLVYSRLATHKYASLFLKPITDDQAPGYHSVIYRPMDLQTIRKNIENGVIRTTAEFQRDVLLMFNNAIMYNKTNQHVYSMTRQIQQEGIEHIHILLQAQQDVPVRRETRTSEPGSKRKRGPEEIIRSKKRKDD